MNILDYFIEAWNSAPECMPFCAPRAQHVTANSLGLLKQYEDQLGHAKYRDCVAPDWSTFPGLDPLVATVLEWGHSMDNDQWAEFPSARFEFKVHVSEWLLNSTKASYLLGDRDTESHTPLMIDVHANQYDRARARTLNRNPETIKEAADRRKQRQKMNKARGSGGAPKEQALHRVRKFLVLLHLVLNDLQNLLRLLVVLSVLQNPHNLLRAAKVAKPKAVRKEASPPKGSPRAKTKARARANTD